MRIEEENDPKLEPWGYYFFFTFWVECQVTGFTLTIFCRGCISRLSSLLPNSYLWIWQSFTNLYYGLKAVQPCRVGLKTVQPCQVFIWVLRQSNCAFNRFQNCSKRVYRQVWLSCITCQDFSHLANTLANTNGLLVSDLHHLVNTLTNTNNIPKMYPRYLASKPWPILMTRLTTTQGKRFGYIQPTAYSSSLGNARRW